MQSKHTQDQGTHDAKIDNNCRIKRHPYDKNIFL